MALYWTNGSTSKKERGPGVLWADGYSSSAVSHVDIVYNDARSAGFDKFVIELYDIEINGYHPLLTPLTAANTVSTSGCYGGYAVNGEGDGNIGGYDASFNNRRGFPISAIRDGLELGNYKGHYTVHVSDPVLPANTNSAYPNVWWTGTHRIATTLASNIIGGGVHNRFDAHYGLRLESNDASNNRILEYGYALYAYRSV